jgi:hypothetical protein
MPDDVELTEAMIEAGRVAYFHFRQGIESDVLFCDLTAEEQEDFVQRIYRAMHAARTPSPVSVEDVARAISDAIWPLADWDGDRCVADAAALKAAEAAIATLSTRP